MMSLSTLVNICNRFSLSHQAGASIAYAVLKDCGIFDGQSKEVIIDRSKVRRESEKERCHNQTFQTPLSVQGLHFDGKKDCTLNPSGVGTLFIRENIMIQYASKSCSF